MLTTQDVIDNFELLDDWEARYAYLVELGEALLGEGEAERRLHSYLAALQNPEIESISVKVSTIFSHSRKNACASSKVVLWGRRTSIST